ncbi:hypothetical protein QR680_003093 [Steinernema hermaphroditum]|uniref:Serine-threonine/tyrosine-protein kinase catalytic domain-containing protein n=1 Tax=Steinernema hermaphroditum TaxID=289476 RepID=A0AA39H798_9BILA|nr:hypothetical protein QR680_003093 [Steinernema hermaphroditum]
MSNHEGKYKLENLKQKLPIADCYGIMMCSPNPYPGMTVGEVNVQLKSGYRMAPPDNMPTALKVIVSKHCFLGDPHERWSMTHIRKSLEDLVSGQNSKKSLMGLTVTVMFCLLLGLTLLFFTSAVELNSCNSFKSCKECANSSNWLGLKCDPFENVILGNVFEVPCDLLNTTKCHAYRAVVHSEKAIVISFRGTQGIP